jgi:hypothetical protein
LGDEKDNEAEKPWREQGGARGWRAEVGVEIQGEVRHFRFLPRKMEHLWELVPDPPEVHIVHTDQFQSDDRSHFTEHLTCCRYAFR